MASDEYRHKKKPSSSSSSVCEMSMLLVSNIITLSTRRLFAAHGLTRNDNVPPPPQGHERLTQPHHDPLIPKPSSKIKITKESADSVSITKPRSYVKPGNVGETLTRHVEIIDDVDAYAGNYITQVRRKINGNHVPKSASSGTSAAD